MSLFPWYTSDLVPPAEEDDPLIERGNIVHQAPSATLATDAAVLEKYLGVTQSERVTPGRRGKPTP